MWMLLTFWKINDYFMKSSLVVSFEAWPVCNPGFLTLKYSDISNINFPLLFMVYSRNPQKSCKTHYKCISVIEGTTSENKIYASGLFEMIGFEMWQSGRGLPQHPWTLGSILDKLKGGNRLIMKSSNKLLWARGAIHY